MKGEWKMTLVNAIWGIGGIVVGIIIRQAIEMIRWHFAYTVEHTFETPIVIPPGESVEIGIGLEIVEEKVEIE